MVDTEDPLRSADTVQVSASEDPLRSADTVQVSASEKTPRDRLFDSVKSLREVLERVDTQTLLTSIERDTPRHFVEKAYALRDFCVAIVFAEPPLAFVDPLYWVTAIRAKNVAEQLQQFLIGQEGYETLNQLVQAVLHFQTTLEIYQQKCLKDDSFKRLSGAFSRLKAAFAVIDDAIMAFEKQFFSKTRGKSDAIVFSQFIMAVREVLDAQQTTLFTFLSSTTGVAKLRDNLSQLERMKFVENGSGEMWMSEVKSKLTAIKQALNEIDLQLQVLRLSGYFSPSGIIEMGGKVPPSVAGDEWDERTITDYPKDFRAKVRRVTQESEDYNRFKPESPV